jgi:uncharacterized protein Yka (UPF0111/DUF47 family)
MSTTFVIPSNPEDRKKLLATMDSICDSLTRIAGEKDFIKAEVEAMAETYEVPKKILNQFVRAYYKMNFNDVKNDTDDLIEFYSALTGKDIDEA